MQMKTEKHRIDPHLYIMRLVEEWEDSRRLYPEHNMRSAYAITAPLWGSDASCGTLAWDMVESKSSPIAIADGIKFVITNFHGSSLWQELEEFLNTRSANWFEHMELRAFKELLECAIMEGCIADDE